MDAYKTIRNTANDEIIIDKSRFIGYSFFVETQEEVEEILKKIRKKHYDATHNCYAYILKEDSSIMKASDDGEPSGTAGIPILEVLKKEGLTNVLVIVTRYFGGIKLGTGGLIRAYTKSAKASIDANIVVEKIPYVHLQATAEYNLVGKIQNYIENENIIFHPPEFMEKVMFPIFVKQEDVDTCIKDLMDISSGVLEVEVKEKNYLDFVGGIYQKR